MTNNEKLEAFRDVLINNLEGMNDSTQIVNTIHAIIDVNFIINDMKKTKM